MAIKPFIGIGEFKLGVSMTSSFWSDIGDNVTFKRNLLQKHPALRFANEHIIVYFDRNHVSYGIEVLGNSAFFNGENLIGLSDVEAKEALGIKENSFIGGDDSFIIPQYGIILYTIIKDKKRVIDSVIICNESYLDSEDSQDLKDGYSP